MNTESLIQDILDVLNFPEDAPFEVTRNFLLEKALCRFELVVADDADRYYSLFSREEVIWRQAQGLPLSLPLLAAIEPIDENRTWTLLGDPRFYQDRVIFPETGQNGADLTRAFGTVVRWFQTFMLGCSAGVMDVATLNKFTSPRKLVLEFQQTKDTMNPILVPTGIREEETDGIVERKILESLIYPFLFSGSGDTLARIRRCRQCGTFFRGVRLHASFCTTKCRMAWNYARQT